MVLNMFLALDLFPNKVELHVKSSEKYRTSTGTIVTLVVIAIVLLQAVSVLDEVFQYHSPLVTSTRSYNRSPGDLGLNSSNFVFAFKVNDPFYNLSESYVSFELSSKVVSRSPDGSVAFSQVYIPLKKCDVEYFKGFEAEYEAYKLGSALCPSTTIYDLSGNFLSDYFSFLAFSARPCKNSTDTPDVICKPIEDIREYMNTEFRIQMFFSNTLLTPGNHSNPISRYIDEVYWDTTPNVSLVKADVMINEQVIVSDDFIWLSGYYVKNESTYQLDLAELRTGYTKLIPGTDPDDFIILQGDIKRSSYVTTTKREYSTISTGLSAIGGIFSFVFGIFGVLIAIYTRRKFLVSVANEMYDFELPDHLKLKKKKKCRFCCCLSRKKEKKTNQKTTQKFDELGSSPALKRDSSDSYHERYERVAKYYKEKSARERNKLSFGFLDFLVSLVSCCRREKDKFVQRAIETVTKDMDILYLIKTSHENQRLKNVLLSKEQQDLMSHACQPIIVTKDLWKNPEPKTADSPKIQQSSPMSESRRGTILSSVNKKEDELTKRESEYKQFMALCKSYQKLFKESKDPTNFKILELLDANLHEALYEMSRIIKDVPMKRLRLTTIKSNKPVKLVQNKGIQSRLAAAIKIATTLQKKFREKKKKGLMISGQGTSENQLLEKEEGKQHDESPLTMIDGGKSPQSIRHDEPSESYDEIPIEPHESKQANEFSKYELAVRKSKTSLELKT